MSDKDKDKPAKAGRLRKRYFVFCMFVILSAVLWLMNKLTQDYVATLRFTPEVKNSNTAAVYTATGDNTLFVQVRASGFFIVRERLMKEMRIVFDVKDLKVAENAKSELRLPTILLKDKFPEYFDGDVYVSAIEPDTIYFNVSRNVTKKVPVTASPDMTFGSEYRQSAPIEFSPDSVSISGAAKELEKIASVNAIIGKFDNLVKSVEDIAALETPYNVAVKPKKVRYKIPVDRCTESAVSVPVNLRNVPAGKFTATLLPSSVSVTYTVPLKHYAKVNPNDFTVSADFNDTRNSLSRKIKVSLQHKPDGVFNLELTPEFVELIVQEKAP